MLLYGLEIMPKLDKTAVAERYHSGKSIQWIAAHYEVCYNSVWGLLKRGGIARRPAAPPRLYTLDEHFFDVINTELKAYWLGFLCADGSISDHQVILRLGWKDREHVSAFARAVGSNAKPVRIEPREAKLTSGQIIKSGPIARIDISSVKIVRALESLGFGKKSERRCYAFVENHLARHFWRGTIDGDGFLGIYGQKCRFKIGLAGTYPLIQAFLAFAAKHVNHAVNAEKTPTVWSAVFTGRAKPAALVSVLYHDLQHSLKAQTEPS